MSSTESTPASLTLTANRFSDPAVLDFKISAVPSRLPCAQVTLSVPIHLKRIMSFTPPGTIADYE